MELAEFRKALRSKIVGNRLQGLDEEFLKLFTDTYRQSKISRTNFIKESGLSRYHFFKLYSAAKKSGQLVSRRKPRPTVKSDFLAVKVAIPKTEQSLTVVTPSGFKVECLGVQSAAELLKALEGAHAGV